MLEPERISMADKQFGLLVADAAYADEIRLNRLVRCLTKQGCLEQNIKIRRVPAHEDIPLGVMFFAEYTDVDAVVVLTEQIPEEFLRRATIDLQTHWNMPVLYAAARRDAETALQHAVEVALLQEEMEIESEEAANPDRMSIN